MTKQAALRPSLGLQQAPRSRTQWAPRSRTQWAPHRFRTQLRNLQPQHSPAHRMRVGLWKSCMHGVPHLTVPRLLPPHVRPPLRRRPPRHRRPHRRPRRPPPRRPSPSTEHGRLVSHALARLGGVSFLFQVWDAKAGDWGYLLAVYHTRETCTCWSGVRWTV